MRVFLSLLAVSLFVDGVGFAESNEDTGIPSAASLRLLEAAYVDSADGVAQALAAGADINATASYDYLKSENYRGSLPAIEVMDKTAAAVTVGEGHAKALKVLLEHGADPNGQYDDMDSMLQRAVGWVKDVEVVRLLLKHGADPNDNGGSNYLILGTAVTNEDVEVARLLLEHGADPNARNGFGNTPLHEAAWEGVLADIPGVLFFLQGKYVKMMRLMLDHGADPNAKGFQGETPLMRAVGFTAGVKLLLARGADIDAIDAKGNTALIHAATDGARLSTVKLLLKAGADTNVANENGDTALHAAADFEDGVPHTTKILLENGANVRAVNKKGETPLDLANAQLKSAEAIFSTNIDVFYNDPDGMLRRCRKTVKIIEAWAAKQQ